MAAPFDSIYSANQSETEQRFAGFVHFNVSNSYSYSNSNIVINFAIANQTSKFGIQNLTLARPSRIATIWAASIMTVFWIFGVLANLLLVLALGVRELKKKRSAVNVIYVFIVSMAANDLLNLCTNQTFVILSYVGHDWIVGGPADRPCQIAAELNMFLVATNMWHQTLIAIHRYIVVVRSQWYLRINKTLYSLVVIIATRVVPLAQSLPILISGEAFNCSVYEPKLLRCVFKPEYKMRTMIAFLTGFVVPCLLVVICFTLVFIFVHRASRRVMHSRRKSTAVYRPAILTAPVLHISTAAIDEPDVCSPQPEKSIDLETTELHVKDAESDVRSTLELPVAKPRRKSAIETIVEHSSRLRASIVIPMVSGNGAPSLSFWDAKLYQREIQITKMFGVVFLVIVLGFVPYGLIRNADSKGTMHPDAYVIVTALYAIASCLPPLIYGLMNQDVRWIVLTFLFGNRWSADPKPLSERNGDQNAAASRVEQSFTLASTQMISLRKMSRNSNVVHFD